jgi:hypothetical protein
MIAAGITKLPDLYLGVDKPIFGPMEFTGVVGTGLDMETASSLYTITAGAYSDATFAYTNFKQQRYSAAWGGKTGFTAFQAQDGWTISHDLKLEPVKIQGRTVDFKIIGYQCMAKCAPIGPSQANIDAELRVQGVGQSTRASAGGKRSRPGDHRGERGDCDAEECGDEGRRIPVRQQGVAQWRVRLGEHGWIYNGSSGGAGDVRVTLSKQQNQRT